MNFLERAIRNGIQNAVGNAVEQGVRSAVQPAVNQAANNLANKAVQGISHSAQAIKDAAANQQPYSANVLCPQCGSKNELGKNFCSNCGAKMQPAPSAEEAVNTAVAAAKFAQEWMRKLPQYPLWTDGGSEFEFSDEEYDGQKYVRFTIQNADEVDLVAYLGKLRANGFAPTDSDAAYFRKTIGNTDYYFDLTAAQGSGYPEYLFYSKPHNT